MSSYITLELDTATPTVNIYAPNNTTKMTDTLYRIVANEKLANIQEFYFIDSEKKRHDITLNYLEESFEGKVSFDFFSKGMATLYVVVYDEALNKSAVYYHSINVYENRELYLEIELIKREMHFRMIPRTRIELSRQNRLLEMSVIPRLVEMEVKDISGTEEQL
jgi:hypothetical protein